MSYRLYDYVDGRGRNDFRAWTQTLEKRDRAKLNAKLDMLEKLGGDLFPHVLTDTDISGIQKLRVKGNVQLRPLLCSGPISVGNEFTLLVGAKEVGSRFVPKDAVEIADSRKQAIVCGESGRVEHERVS